MPTRIEHNTSLYTSKQCLANKIDAASAATASHPAAGWLRSWLPAATSLGHLQERQRVRSETIEKDVSVSYPPRDESRKCMKKASKSVLDKKKTEYIW
jgi:hypothetical protein